MRAGADMREAEPHQELADRALMIGDPEPLEDDTLEIDPPPAYDPVHGSVRSGIDQLGNLGPLGGRETRLGTFGPAVQKAVRPRALNR